MPFANIVPIFENKKAILCWVDAQNSAKKMLFTAQFDMLLQTTQETTKSFVVLPVNIS
jgi:hypothetical protein